MLIYDDKNNNGLFDTFCELNVLSEFIFYAVSYNDREITLQIIKSLSVFILSIQNNQSLYYIFSNNFLNKIISLNKISEIDYDFLSYYVNFLKSLSLKLTNETIEFFFHQDINSFPLFENAFHLYNYNDAMISNVIRNIFLALCKKKNEAFNNVYLASLPSVEYFAFISCRLRERIQILYCNCGDLLNFNYENVCDFHDDIMNDIMYIQDIFSLENEKINFILTNCLMYYLILPCLCGVICETSNQKFCDKKISLFILTLFLFYIKNETFLNCLFIVLTFDMVPKSIIRFVEEIPGNSKNYCFDFEKTEKLGKSDNFLSFVTNHFDIKFFFGVLKEGNEYGIKYKNDIEEIKKRIQYDKHEILNEEKIFNGFWEHFSSAEKANIKRYHYEISIATGVSCGCTKRNEDENAMYDRSVLGKINKMINKISQGKTEKFVKNTIKTKLYSLMRANDDNIKMLISIFLHVLIIKANIDKKLRNYVKIISFKDYSKFIENKPDISNTNNVEKLETYQVYNFDAVYFSKKNLGDKNKSEKESFSYDNNLALGLISVRIYNILT